MQSADLLGLKTRRVVMDEAREAAVPRRVFCPIRVRPITLIVFARVLWLLGVVRGAESKAEARSRARRLAARLEALAGEAGHVVVVGHGYTHRFCARALRDRGWAAKSGGSGYWSLTQLQKAAIQPAEGPRILSGAK